MSLLTFLFGQKPIHGDGSVPYAYSTEYFRAVESGNSIPDLIRAMADYSGYIRQAAIARAVTLRHTEFLPAIAARLNDWVPQVRDAARSALLTVLPVVPQDAMLAVLPAVANLRNAGRHDHTAWLAAFERELLRQIEPQVFTAGVLGVDVKIARACFGMLRRHPILHDGILIEIGLGSNDIVTCLQAVSMIGALDERKLPYKMATLSRFGSVRAIGLRGCLEETDSVHNQETATLSLLDSQSCVRAVAIAWLTANNCDVRQHFHQILASPTSSARDIRISLTELGALRQSEDADTVSSFATDTIIAVRTAAYAAWFKLADGDKDMIAARALGDVADRVKKLAMEMVTRHGAFIPFATACSLLTRGEDWALLMRLGGNGKWDVLEAIARIAPAADYQTRTELRARLESWTTSTFNYHRPTAAQAALLRSDEANAVLASLAGRDLRDIVERELSLALAKRR
jgi:hypothetical protein